jgi:hypothetical protein
MANDRNVSNHSTTKNVKCRPFGQPFVLMISGLIVLNASYERYNKTSLGGKRHHYHNRNCVDKMACGRSVVGRGPTPQAVNSTMKELRLAHKFTPSQSSSSVMRLVTTHSPPPQRQLSPTNRVPGGRSRSMSYFPTYPIDPTQSKGANDDSPTYAHPNTG